MSLNNSMMFLKLRLLLILFPIASICNGQKKDSLSHYSSLVYPFLTPGSNQYDNVLQDWDCWDERAGFFYSVDLNLRPLVNREDNTLGISFMIHAGFPRDYDCLIQRIEVWTGFMAMWTGLATPEQAERIKKEHLSWQQKQSYSSGKILKKRSLA